MQHFATNFTIALGGLHLRFALAFEDRDGTDPAL